MLQDVTQNVLAKALDAAALRNRAISNNLANVETPGYRRLDVSFESELREALDAPSFGPEHEADIDRIEAKVIRDGAQVAQANGNGVDVDREMARLSENTIQYQALLQSMSIKGAMVRAAIHEGRR